MNKREFEEAENIVFVVQGGIGRNIMATAVCRAIKKAYPQKKLMVICGCSDVFLRNPWVDRIYHFGQPVFVFEDYFMKGKSVVINTEPYQHYDYIYKRKHMVECWCDQIGIPCDGVYPEMSFTEAEIRMAAIFLEKFDKEMILLQGEGGKVPDEKSEKAELISKSTMYKRSLRKEIMQGLTDDLIKRNYAVGMVCTPNQFLPKGAERINFPIRSIVALIPHCASVVSIDSFLLHGAAIFKKPIVAIWGGTDARVLGYPDMMNMTHVVCDNPACHRPNTYLWDLEANGFMWDCPVNDKCMDWEVKDIMAELDKILGGQNGRSKEKRVAVADCNGKCGDNKGDVVKEEGRLTKSEGSPAT